MFLFMFNDYKGDDLWHYDEQRRRAARAGGFVFSAEEWAAILPLWAGVATAAPVCQLDRAIVPTQAGRVVITPRAVILSDEPSAAELRAGMAHAASQWGGRASIPYNPATGRTYRLQARAFAEVYGIELHDANDLSAAGRFTADELAGLPAMRRAIRAAFADAPPERPDEQKQIAAGYARRYPFRIAAAA